MTENWIKSLKVGDPVYVETGSFDDRKLEKDRVHSITQNGIELVKSENYFNQRGTESRIVTGKQIGRAHV